MLCFDGTNFFGTSHTVGNGNNIVTGTAVATDGVTHAMSVLVMRNSLVKPLLWQDREAPTSRPTAAPSRRQLRMVHWWTDLRCCTAFGFWWDAVLVKWANTPTVQEVQTTLGNVNARLRGYTYPKNLPTDVNQYQHGQTTFSDKNVLIVCSSLIEHIVRQALTLSLIATTENYFKNWAKLICSGYLDAVV